VREGSGHTSVHELKMSNGSPFGSPSDTYTGAGRDGGGSGSGGDGRGGYISVAGGGGYGSGGGGSASSHVDEETNLYSNTASNANSNANSNASSNAASRGIGTHLHYHEDGRPFLSKCASEPDIFTALPAESRPLLRPHTQNRKTEGHNRGATYTD
jgi:hypothetical protein